MKTSFFQQSIDGSGACVVTIEKKNECVLRVVRVRGTYTAILLSYIHFILHYIIYIFLDKTRLPSHQHIHL